jgi:hypothetical protein
MRAATFAVTVFGATVLVISAIFTTSPAFAQSSPSTPSPISREELAAIMKHPTEPHYDPLRPMSGRWVRCRPAEPKETAPAAAAANTAAPSAVAPVRSIQDRYSSSDRSHFTHAVVRASDSDCKTAVSEERTSYECTQTATPALTCKVLKKELKAGSGAWLPTKTSEDSSIKLTFVGAKKRRKRKKTREPRQLEIRIAPEAGGEPELIRLEFVPSVPHAPSKKHPAGERAHESPPNA